MCIRVQVIIEADQEATAACVKEVACFERGPLSKDSLGLRLDEAKQMLAGVQQVMTEQQIEDYVGQQRQCSHCQQPLACKVELIQKNVEAKVGCQWIGASFTLF